MKQVLKKRIGLSILLVFGTTVLSSLYQNCSKVTLNDLDAEAKAAEAERVALGKDDEVVTAGTSPVPGLSMYFIVDNSGTMVQNQLNLAQSFGAMFDASAESLAKFETTTYIMNTAQRSPSFTSELATLDAIADRQKNFTPTWLINLTDFQNSIRTATTNGGQIPGDNLGYHLKKANTTNSSIGTLSYEYAPAYLQGATMVNASQVSLSPSIHKAALESSAAMEDEFKRRLDVLNATRFPYNRGVAEFANIVDAESGLCAIARALRNQTPGDPASPIRADNLTSMVVVSDENDNDPQGNNCIQSVVKTTDSTPYIDGQCRLPATSLEYRSLTPNPDTCTYTVYTGYKATWTYANPRVGTSFEYRAKYADAYYKKKTFWVKYENKTKKYKVRKTNLTFYGLEGNPIISDGIVTNQDSWEPIAAVISKPKLNGYVAPGSACLALARTYETAIIRSPTIVKGLKVDTTRAVTCDPVWEDVGTTACNVSDTNNCMSYNDTTTKTGNYGLNTAAAAQNVANADSNYLGTPILDRGQESDSVTATCSTGDQTAGFCYLVPADIRWKAHTVNDQDLYSVANGCYNYANSTANLSDSVVNNDPANVRNCAKTNYGNKTQTVSMTFADANDGGTTLVVNSSAESCSNANMRSKALQLAQAADPVIKSSDRCSVVEITKLASNPSAPLASGNANCNIQVASYCSTSQPGNRCTASQTPTSPSPSAWSAFVTNHPEAVNCSTKCNASTQNLCNGQNPTLTVAQHLQAIYGAGGKTVECRVSSSGYLPPGSDPGLTTHTGVLVANTGTICSELPGPTRTFVATRSQYTLPAQVITDYVAGTAMNASGQPVPKMGLVDYIKQRSQELTGGQMIFTALVRKSTDPLGNNGSTGVAYEQLVQQTGGVLESVLSTDYSVALRNLSSVIKNNLEKTFLLKKMRPNQIITRVYLIKKGTDNPILLPQANWVQNGATLRIESLDFVEGDQFKVEFQNYIK